MPSMRAVLFDLDNTLMDRSNALRRYISRFTEHFAAQIDGMALDAVEAIFIEADGGGYTPKPQALEQVRQHLAWKDRPSFDEMQAHYHETYPYCALEMPGAKETLVALRARGLKTAIITNGGTRTQNTKIDLLDLRDLVDAVVVSEAAGIKKPDARIFAMALEQIEVEASAAIFVGDHPVNDVLGAQSAGLAAVWMCGYHAWPQNESEPQWQVDRLIDILDLEL